jgi:hypothetical protein
LDFFEGIRNIERVRSDLRQYFEKDFMPWYIKHQKTDENNLYDIVENALLLAEKLHMDYNMCFTIACMHDLDDIDSDTEDNNFTTLMSVQTDQNLNRFFQDFELEIISAACKEHDGSAQDRNIHTSLYSKMINDAVILSVIKIEPMLRHYWVVFNRENPDDSDVELFNKMYSELKQRYGKNGTERLLLEIARDLVKEEWKKTIKILDSYSDTKHQVLQLAKYHEIMLKNDGTLKPDMVVTKKEILREEEPDVDTLFEDFENSLFDEPEDLEESVDVLLSEAPSTKTKREQTEAIMYKVLSILDESGVNVRKYREFFGQMSDEQFDRYMRKFISDDDENFYLEILPNVNEPSMPQIKKALDALKVPTDEYVYLRHDGNKDDPIRTAYKVPVG